MQRFFGVCAVAVLIAFMSIVVFEACKDKDCSVIKPYSDIAASTMAKTLDCKGVDAMKADFITFCAEKGLCKGQPMSFDASKGPIASMLCPVLVPWLVGFGSGKLPPAWQCSGAPVEATLIMACNAIPF